MERVEYFIKYNWYSYESNYSGEIYKRIIIEERVVLD